jgi:hypothetical protein
MFKGSSYLLVRHEQRHSFRVSWIDMTVSVQDQFAAITMSLPQRNYFYIDASFDRSRDEHSS